MVPIGAVLAGKYRVERILGQGGMGVVVQATHLQLHQPVAMKFLLPEVLTNAQVVQRFLREAQAVVRLKSEHVARVIDVGSLEDGAPYMVLEYLDGTDLSHFSRQQLTIGQIIDLMLQACEALAEAHAIGIVHRDIKPANFFITRHTDGSLLLKVLDFGISKIQQSTLEGNLTATSTVMGTPSYMSPEQMKSSRDVDNRSDVWALGIVLYELLQGVPPFVAESFSGIAIKIATEPLPPLSAQLPQGLAAVVYRCLEKDPTRRFQNVAELAYALAPYAQSTAQAVMSVERTSRVLRIDPPRSTRTSSTGAITQPPRPVRRMLVIIGAGGLLGAIVGVAVMVSQGSDKANEPDPQAVPAASTPASPTPPDREPTLPEAPGTATLTPPLDAAPPAVDAAVATTPPNAGDGTSPQLQEKKPKPRNSKQTQSPGNSTEDILGDRH